MRAAREIIVWSIFAVLLILVLSAVILYGTGALRLPQRARDNERAGLTHSIEYVQTQQHALADQQAEYAALDVKAKDYPDQAPAIKGQQAAIVRQMREEASLIPDDALPSSARSFLVAHP